MRTLNRFLLCWLATYIVMSVLFGFHLHAGALLSTFVVSMIAYLPCVGMAGLWSLGKKYAKPVVVAAGTLDDVLFRWPSDDPFTVRHMLRSVEVKGITGSGKSSGSGKYFTEAIVRHPRSTCLILAQKPEDKEFYQEIFRRHRKPLVVIEEGSKWRCNFLDTEMKAGADTRGLVEFLTTLGEAIEGGQARGGENAQFWRKLEERITFGAVEALKQGVGTVSAPDLQKFLSTAAYSPQQLLDAAWKEKSFHHQVMQAAYAREKTDIERYDFDVIKDLWTNEFPNMDDKPRSSGLAGIMNTLSTFNTGLVRLMCSTETNITPAALDEGVSILLNYPFIQCGPTGRFNAGGWKYMCQKHILRRHWKPGDYWNVLICDEFQESVTEFDPRYLAMCRSHGGCLFALTQTIHSEYGQMGGGAGQHKADALLSNFGLHVYHTSDPKTAAFAASLLGQRRETFANYTPNSDLSYGEELFGRGGGSCSLSESYQPVLQPSVFMSGLRCGGPPDFVVDGIVIRSGEPFRSGENWQLVSFSQK